MANLAQFVESGAFGDLNHVMSTFSGDDGYALPNRFEALILPPINVTIDDSRHGHVDVSHSDPWLTSNDARLVSMRCESTTMPGRNLSSEEDTNIYGPSREIVSGVTYAGDLEILFQASAGLKERVFFEEWQKKAFNEQTWNVNYHSEYVSEVQIYLLDKQNQRRYGIRLHEVWPKTIAGIALNQAPSSEIIKIPVTFSFRWWETLDVTRGAPSLREKRTRSSAGDFAAQRNIARNQPAVLDLHRF